MAGQTTNYLFDYPTSTDYVKDGATAIETLADDVDATLFTALGGAYPGLRLIKKQTIGTAVSSVAVTGAFSTTYDNYKIVVSGAVGSMNNNLNLRLGSTTTGYYYSSIFMSFAGVSTNDYVANGSFFQAGTFNTNVATINLELLNPFASLPTVVNGSMIDPTVTGRAGTTAGYLANTTSYTDFTLITGGGTVTGGTVYVYGYGKS